MLMQSALLALGATAVAALQPLEVDGNNFINPKTGNRFQIVGMAYQPGGSAGYDPKKKRDPLSDPDVCMRDAALLQILGVNAIRVYNLNPDLNHDECVSIFNAAGMYMLLDVNSPMPGEALTSFEVYKSYYASYLNRTFAVVEAFKDYPNTLAFFSGNEVIDKEETTEFVPSYVRAVTRDLKNYIKKHSKRAIPVGYSAADVRDVLWDTFNYFTCSLQGDKDDMSKGDLFALNSYSWCGDSSFTESSFDDLVEGFKSTPVPIFFSEFGCNTPSPRIFTEIGSIYGPDMHDVFAGGIVYEYTQEANNYGIVNMTEEGPATLMSDFYSLKEQYAKLDFSKLQSLKPTGSAPKPVSCSAKLITVDGFQSNFTLPVLPPGAAEIIEKGVSPKPKGKLVEITDWKVKFEVKNADGSVIKDLAVKPLADDEVNAPGSNSANLNAGSGSSGSGSSGSNSESSTNGDKENDAAGRGVGAVLALVMGVVAMVAAF
ncbi:Glucanosyltransferase-domain-containing protein [Apiosordaria backusii]|uniref:1,3-beta-glucanosyltransferase n=1 Tax=Apiosordaria backusii TaxID=314023 RepID=A0AA40EXZ8_9PEZI|nr:Glucanosyltransferase-domain-containing protein [Apiosordaria backusii]